MPGVSTSTRPCCSSALGTTISTRSTRLWLPGLPISLTQSPTCSIGIVSVVGGSPAFPDSAPRRTTATGCSPQRTSVIADVARSSSTGQMDCASRALIKELLPCLNSPTTHTTVAGRRTRAAATDARSARSARPICCSVLATSMMSASGLVDASVIARCRPILLRRPTPFCRC